ncbi:glycosyl hydrolase family 28 [Pseudobacter ginsenosidimutans]|uniref:Glycosyl hydrolase family 28 n=1 Tax=Pseudobacter ginsenosidimutans TaxID=661488 RepID=A0A4V2F2A0_9BACT|nr:glycosyl hydrolase family 28 [Pseudobacter ginsenosidimutans]
MCCLVFTGSIALAQHTALPQIPANTFLVTSFGAAGDGKTLNTVTIQRALDSARIHGGKVIIPKGIFLCGPLQMYSHTALELQSGAILRLRNDIANYPIGNERYLNFISILDATDIKISGPGTIDGQGQNWWTKYTDKELQYRRPQLLFIEKCKRVELEGILTLDPPNTHISLRNCTDVYIHDIRIQAPDESRNTDGINVSARNCTIENCDIRTGDDNIAINFGDRNKGELPQCSDILIRNCFFGVGHGLSIGSFTSGGLRNLKVEHCEFDGTTSGLRIKSARGRGGIVENLRYSDLTIKNCKWPIFFSCYYPKEPLKPEQDTSFADVPFMPVFRNIRCSNIRVVNAGTGIRIWGLPGSPITDCYFENVQINADKPGEISYAKGLRFISSTIKMKPELYHAEVSGL